MQVRGVRPFFSEKYDITRHPRYKYLSDADKKNTFDVDSYLSSLRRKKAARGNGGRNPLTSTTLTCRMKILPQNKAADRERSVTRWDTRTNWTFADYFRYEKEIYRAIISAAVLCQWIAEHDTPPTDGEAEELGKGNRPQTV